MLKNIYTEFDNFCGLVDVYKIETIGDAYIVAAGLHKSSKYHAQRAAWMSLLMMDAASKSFTTKNEKIKVI
jgi:guanylate cyclase soluble subunit alpha